MPKNQQVAILNSRQGLYPCRLHSWIKQSHNLLKNIQSTNPIILSSIGMSTWDVVTLLASTMNLSLKIYIHRDKILSDTDQINRITDEYNLDLNLTSFFFIEANSVKEFQSKRDSAIIESADKIFPISVREKGNLEKLIHQHNNKVDTTYKTTYNKQKDKIAYTLSEASLNHGIQNISNDYIIHWTKTSKNKLKQETVFDYYTSILSSDSYPRTALLNLSNILHQKTIIASSTHMPQNIPTVSFTSLTPSQMVPLFRWRSRYQEMSFEPYGIGIKKEIALQNKIQEVIYYDKNLSTDSKLENNNIWLTQSRGIHTNWESEQEYRHNGDFIFNNINSEDIILFCRYKKEAELLQEQTGIQTIHFQS